MDKDELVIQKKRGEDGYRVFSVRIRYETLNRIDEIVNKSGRSRNEIIGILLEYAIDKCRIEG